MSILHASCLSVLLISSLHYIDSLILIAPCVRFFFSVRRDAHLRDGTHGVKTVLTIIRVVRLSGFFFLSCIIVYFLGVIELVGLLFQV